MITKNTLQLHEDSYRQVELIPKENFFNLNTRIDKLEEKRKDNFGFYDIDVRTEISFSTSNLAITSKSILELLMTNALALFESISIGHGNNYPKKLNSKAFGYERLSLCVEFKNEILENIWLDSHSVKIDFLEPYNLHKTLHSIGNKFNLCLVDWNEECVINLNNEAIIKDYLSDVYWLYGSP